MAKREKRLDDPHPDPAEVIAAERACDAIGEAAEKMTADQDAKSASCSKPLENKPSQTPKWGDVTVVQRGSNP